MILDGANDLRLQYLTLSLIAVMIFRFFRRKIAFWISLALLAINAVAIFPWYLPPANAAKNPDGQPFKLLAINVLNQNKAYDQVLDWIRHEDADLIVLSEVINQKWSPWSSALSVLQDDWPYHVRQDDMDIEVYSRWPLQLQHEQHYEKEGYPIVRGFVDLAVAVDGQTVRAIASHAFPSMYYGNDGFVLRNQQLDDLGTYLAAVPGTIVVAGDLNVTVWSPHYRGMMKQSGLRDARRGFGILPSLSTFHPEIPIFAVPVDHSFVSPDVQVTHVYTGPNVGSDHLPITTEMRLP